MCAQFGGRDVKLTRKEILDMHNNIFEEGIEIVGFKKSAVDPKDLTCPTRFVQCAMLHRRQTPGESIHRKNSNSKWAIYN